MQQDHMQANFALEKLAPGKSDITTMHAPIADMPSDTGTGTSVAIIDATPKLSNTTMRPSDPTSLASKSTSGADRPDKYVLETQLIELGAALTAAQQLFKGLERDFYLGNFGRYDD